MSIQPCNDDCDMEVGTAAPMCGAPATVHHEAYAAVGDCGEDVWVPEMSWESTCSLAPEHPGRHDATAPLRWEWHSLPYLTVPGVTYAARHRHRDPHPGAWGTIGPLMMSNAPTVAPDVERRLSFVGPVPL